MSAALVVTGLVLVLGFLSAISAAMDEVAEQRRLARAKRRLRARRRPVVVEEGDWHMEFRS